MRALLGYERAAFVLLSGIIFLANYSVAQGATERSTAYTILYTTPCVRIFYYFIGMILGKLHQYAVDYKETLPTKTVHGKGKKLEVAALLVAIAVYL